MSRYYVLIKRKGSSKWLGAFPSKPGISKAKIQSDVRKNLRPGFVAKIVSSATYARLAGRSRGRNASVSRGRVRSRRTRVRHGRKRRMSRSTRRRLLANLRRARSARRRRR